MPIRIVHTADWHIGQAFHDYDRREEHLHFLNWLRKAIREQNADVVLVSGDVFDNGNPSAESLQLFYSFLSKTVNENPGLQIVVTAGNHDSGQRLESPRPFLEAEGLPVKNIHLIGTIPRTEEGIPDYDKLLIPLYTRTGNHEAWCLAVPFLRQGDTPSLPEGLTGYAASVEAFYRQAIDLLQTKSKPNQAILAMGHMHVSQSTLSDMDTNERSIIGGMDGIPVTAFPDLLAYVALGHIHKAQALGGKEHIRYSGSPLPMSFSEKNYKHKVILLEISNSRVSRLEHLEIPLLTPVLTLPEKPLPLEEVLEILSVLEISKGKESPAPYLEVLVLEDRPDPSRKKKIQDALEGKHARLAKITPVAVSDANKSNAPGAAFGDFKALKPEELFKIIYQKEFGNEVPDDLLGLFREIESTNSNSEL